MMYGELVKSLRNMSKMGMKYGMAVVKMREAADAIEKLCGLCADQSKDCSEAVAKYLELWAKQPRWIPVSERLPKDNEAVNVTWINRDPESYYQHIKDKPFVATGVYYQGQWYWWSAVVEDILAEYGKCDFEKIDEAIDITHWMPLPTPHEFAAPTIIEAEGE